MSKSVSLIILVIALSSAVLAADYVSYWSPTGNFLANLTGGTLHINGVDVCLEDGTDCPVAGGAMTSWLWSNGSETFNVTSAATVRVLGSADISVQQSEENITIDYVGAAGDNWYATAIAVTNDSGKHTLSLTMVGAPNLTVDFDDQTGAGSGEDNGVVSVQTLDTYIQVANATTANFSANVSAFDDRYLLNSGDTATGNYTFNGNLTIRQDDRFCFNAACTAYEYYNGSHLLTVTP